MDEIEFTKYSLRPAVSLTRGRHSINSSLLVALTLAMGLIVSCLFMTGVPRAFINIEGLVIVVGGTLASTFIQFSVLDVRNAFCAIGAAATLSSESPHERMTYLLEVSRRVKERGILTLEEENIDTGDEFLKLGMALVVDGHAIEDTKRILQTEMKTSSDSANRSVHVWETMGNFAPAMGLIGTLIGLIQMLGALEDSATVAPAMAMALVATLYGAVSANVFFFPIAGKLRALSQEREQSKRITLEGLLSIARLENPIMLEQRLQSFASVTTQSSLY